MADISSYFTYDAALSKKHGIKVNNFTGVMVDFIQDCAERFRSAYISDRKINDIMVKKKKAVRNEIIERRLPKEGKNQSGDFGEILSFYFASETWASDSNIRPMKLRWKELPDMASHLTDIILLKIIDPNKPNPNDIIYTVESKSRATVIAGTTCSINEALTDAVKDKTERAAKTIPYLITKYEDDGDYDLSKLCERFCDSVNYPYKKHHTAMAIVNAAYKDKHLSNIDANLLVNNPDIEVYLLPIADMDKMYKDIFTEMPKY